MDNFEQIRSHLVSSGYKLTLQDPFLACVELSLSQGRRHQAIFLSELQDDDGRHYLRVSTAVAPITDEAGKLVGILTNRDLRFETNYARPIYEVMTTQNLITAPVGTTHEQARQIPGGRCIGEVTANEEADQKPRDLFQLRQVDA